MNLEVIIVTIISYLIGSIPTGIIVAKIMGAPDPRTIGSGNIGATNVGRAAGKTAGIITLIGDVLKGFFISVLAMYIFGNIPEKVTFVCLAVFLGHIFPIFLKFKGGKGVATALGIFFAIGWLQMLFGLILFIILVAIFRYVSLGSMIAAAVMPVLFSIFPSSRPFILLSVIMSALIVLRHSDNIKRLINGTENRVGGKKSE